MDFKLNDDQRAVVETARGLALRHAKTPSVSWEEAGEFPWEFCRQLAAHGLTGIDIPVDAGGQGGELIDSVLVLEAVGRVGPHLADAVQATNFGAVRQIAAFGTQRVREEVLERVLRGEALATIGMSEPGGGSAVGSLRTRAERSGGDVLVSGAKVFNSNGPHATHYVVWARFGEGREGIGAVVVPADTPGLSKGRTERFLSGEAHCGFEMDGCRVPADYVLLDRDGMKRMMTIFNIERLGNATRSYAFGELAFELMTDYMVDRDTAGGRLEELQGLRWKVADLRMRLDAAALLLYRAATETEDGAPVPSHTSIAKAYANETGFAAANEALQVFGGYGFTSDSALSYIFHRTRGWMIAGGTVEIQRNRIARDVFARIRR